MRFVGKRISSESSVSGSSGTWLSSAKIFLLHMLDWKQRFFLLRGGLFVSFCLRKERKEVGGLATKLGIRIVHVHIHDWASRVKCPFISSASHWRFWIPLLHDWASRSISLRWMTGFFLFTAISGAPSFRLWGGVRGWIQNSILCLKFFPVFQKAPDCTWAYDTYAMFWFECGWGGGNIHLSNWIVIHTCFPGWHHPHSLKKT